MNAILVEYLAQDSADCSSLDHDPHPIPRPPWIALLNLDRQIQGVCAEEPSRPPAGLDSSRMKSDLGEVQGGQLGVAGL